MAPLLLGWLLHEVARVARYFAAVLDHVARGGRILDCTLSGR